MANKFINYFSNVLKYNEKEVYIALHDKTNEPYFHANQLCKLLEYVDCKDALRQHVNKDDIVYLKNIVEDYKLLYKNVQGTTKFLNEPGMYSLILKSKNKKAVEIFNWITHEVMPSLRKFGEYKINNNLKTEIDELQKTIENLTNEIEVLQHDLKKDKFTKQNVVYILRQIDNTMKFNTEDIIYVKFGKTKKMSKRKPVYDTSNRHRTQIIKEIPVKDINAIEFSVLKKMNDYRIKNNKEFFECSYNTIIDIIADCVYFFEDINIDKTPDIKISRQNNIPFDKYKDVKIQILNDKEFDELSIQSINNTIEQTGGENKYFYQYLKYKFKYLELKFGFLDYDI
jgi:prophage antirepressor-like protein